MGHVEKEVPVPHSQAWSVMDCVVVGCCGMQVVDVDAGIHAMSRINVSIRMMMDVGRIVDLIGSMCEEILRSNSAISPIARITSYVCAQSDRAEIYEIKR